MKEYFAFQWHITDECDQRCKHCYIFSENNCKHLDAMTWEQIQETFYNCMDFCEVYGRLPYFYITGGDPILHPDFWRLLALLKEHDIPFAILGNPFHLTDEVCMRLKGYGCRKYQLSLDGMRETHDWFRKPGSFDCTLEKIGCINRAGIRSVVMTTERMPARLMHPIFSSVQSKEPGLRNQSCVSRMPSRESWYFRQPYPFRRMQTSSVRWNGLPRMAKGMSCSFKSASSRQKSG